jgi:hypothetical protein
MCIMFSEIYKVCAVYACICPHADLSVMSDRKGVVGATKVGMPRKTNRNNEVFHRQMMTAYSHTHMVLSSVDECTTKRPFFSKQMPM